MSKRPRKPQEPKEITERDLKNTFFVPMTRMKQVIDYIDMGSAKTTIRCNYNLLNLKHERSSREFFDETVERFSALKHKTLFVSACYKALYAHDWDRLLYILKRVPRWRFKNLYLFHIRMLTLLLMYHPDSQSKGYFNEYLHMVWGCRSDQDKKAILKVILTLRKKMFRTVLLEKLNLQDLKGRKEAIAAMAEIDED